MFGRNVDTLRRVAALRSAGGTVDADDVCDARVSVLLSTMVAVNASPPGESTCCESLMAPRDNVDGRVMCCASDAGAFDDDGVATEYAVVFACSGVSARPRALSSCSKSKSGRRANVAAVVVL